MVLMPENTVLSSLIGNVYVFFVVFDWIPDLRSCNLILCDYNLSQTFPYVILSMYFSNPIVSAVNIDDSL